MTAFYEIKPNKILSYTYKTYPSYSLSFVGFPDGKNVHSSSIVNLFDNAPIVRSRSFIDDYGNFSTASADPSGYAAIVSIASTPSYWQSWFTSSVRLRDIYASSSFVKRENFASASIPNSLIQAIYSIPEILYGSEIKPGSLVITGGVNAAKAFDDGYGGFFFQDSNNSPSLIGTVLYQHGIVLSVSPPVSDLPNITDDIILSFSGTNITPQNIYILDLPKGEANFSTNTSYTNYDTGSAQRVLAISQPKTYPTTIGLYNEDYELVATIKLATPLYHDENTPTQIRAKFNF